MGRPRKGTPGCEEATRKWRETMLSKYGGRDGLHQKMQEAGRIGGTNGRGPDYRGGFAADHERAKRAGSEGGKKSHRFSKHIRLFESNRGLIIQTRNGKGNLKALADRWGIPYSSLLHYVHTQIKE